MKRIPRTVLAAVSCLLLLNSCTAGKKPEHTEAYLAAEDRLYASYDLAEASGITFDDLILPLVDENPEEAPAEETEPETSEPEVPNYTGEEGSFPVRFVEEVVLYESADGQSVSGTLKEGDTVVLTPQEDGIWAEAASLDGVRLGYVKDGFRHAVDSGCRLFAELPIEYGYAKTNQETYVEAFSHLVDVRKYFRTCETLSTDFHMLDLANCDLVISMKLSTNETTIGEPFYHRNLCLLQYDILPMLEKAVERFKQDGFTVIIYDAYRPTSVQQRWFDVVRVHKWVADPSIGMGGVHDRGIAIDMSLIDANGNLLEMPTPMHTFTEASARNSPYMTQTARNNMDYMLSVMLECGFTYINSEWWHFQDVNTKYYLPTDHPIDSIPLIASES